MSKYLRELDAHVMEWTQEPSEDGKDCVYEYMRQCVRLQPLHTPSEYINAIGLRKYQMFLIAATWYMEKDELEGLYTTRPKSYYKEMMSIIKERNLSEFIRNRVAFAFGKITEEQFDQAELLVKLHEDLDDAHDLETNELTRKYDLDLLALKRKFDSIDEYDYEHQKIEINRKYDLLDNPKLKEDIDYKYDYFHIENDYEFKKIDSDTQQKRIHTLDKKVWVSFNINVDTDGKDPSAWEFDLDYNRYFVEWLIDNGYGLDPNFEQQLRSSIESGEEGAFDTVEEGIEHYTIEFWFKNNLTKIVAGFLKSKHGNNFRSVLANDPASTIIEELQLDFGDFSGEPTDEFKDFVDEIKTRKSYR